MRISDATKRDIVIQAVNEKFPEEENVKLRSRLAYHVRLMPEMIEMKEWYDDNKSWLERWYGVDTVIIGGDDEYNKLIKAVNWMDNDTLDVGVIYMMNDKYLGRRKRSENSYTLTKFNLYDHLESLDEEGRKLYDQLKEFKVGKITFRENLEKLMKRCNSSTSLLKAVPELEKYLPQECTTAPVPVEDVEYIRRMMGRVTS